MKNFLKLVGIIAAVAVIGFSIVACGDSGGGGSGKIDNATFAKLEGEWGDSYPTIEFFISGSSKKIKIGAMSTGIIKLTSSSVTYLIDVDPTFEFTLSDNDTKMTVTNSGDTDLPNGTYTKQVE